MAADGLTKVGNGIAALAGEFPKVISGTTLAVSAIGVVAAAFSAFKMGKGLVNIARGVMGARDKNDIQKVFVTNADGSDDSRPDSKSSKLLNIAEIGLKALGGKKEEEREGEGDEKAGFDPIETGLKVLDVLREAKGDDDEDAGPQKVFVVNAGDMLSLIHI